MSTRLTHAERRGKKPWKYYLSMEQILARREKAGRPVTDWNEELAEIEGDESNRLPVAGEP